MRRCGFGRLFAVSKPGPNREATEVHLTMTHFWERRRRSEAANAMCLDKRSLSAVAANVLWILSVTALKKILWLLATHYGHFKGSLRSDAEANSQLKLEQSKQINQTNSLPEKLLANCSGLFTSAAPSLIHLGALRCSKC